MLETFERVYTTPIDKDHWLAMRIEDLTSTEISALFNLSPYITLFELWHNKKNKIITSIEETERMGWGNRLEKVIGENIIEEQLWTGSQMKDYVRIPELRMGTSFDFFVNTDEGEGVLEIKNVDQFVFYNAWLHEGDNTEAPPHIEIQLQYQLLVSGRKLGYIGALVGGNRLVIIKREANEDIQVAILKEAEKFWKTIDANEPPAPDFARDAEFMASLHKHAEPGKIIESNEEIDTLVMGYKKSADMMKACEIEKQKFKAMILEIIQDAEKVKGLDFSISAGVIGEAEVAYTRKPYRNFKITFKGQKNVTE